MAFWRVGALACSSAFTELGCCHFMVIKRGKPFIQKMGRNPTVREGTMQPLPYAVLEGLVWHSGHQPP